MRADLLTLAAQLAARGEAFAMATVVRREPPSSAQVGNAALVTAAGEFHGWLGGSCIRPTVRREAMAAIRDAAPRLISISPDPEAARRPGLSVFPMTCHSGGSVEVYVDPVLPAPRLLVFGATPVARALAGLGREMGYAVESIDPGEAGVAISAAPAGIPCFAVVAAQGEGDEDAIEAALALDPAYLGVVASRRRFGEMRALLAAKGIDGARLDRIRNPAGLDLGTPFNFTSIAGNLPSAPALLWITVLWKPAATAMLSAHSRLDCGPESRFFARLRHLRGPQQRRLLAPESWPGPAVDFVSRWLIGRGWNVTLQEVAKGRANVWASRAGGGAVWPVPRNEGRMSAEPTPGTPTRPVRRRRRSGWRPR